jgi:hypothetical protein
MPKTNLPPLIVAKPRDKSNPPVPRRRPRRKSQPQSFSFQEFLVQCRQLSTAHLKSEKQQLHKLALEIAGCMGAINTEIARREQAP